MATLDKESLRILAREGFDPSTMAVRQSKELPANAYGIPGLLMREARQLKDTGASGFVLDSSKPGVNTTMSDAMFLSPQAGPQTISHEAEHLMARRQLGSAPAINAKFDELMGGMGRKDRAAFVNAAIDAAPYLEEKYGLQSGYFDPKMAKFQGALAPNLLFEQLATLASIEQTQNVDLTKDPVLRKTLFKDPAVRETYNALTGLRQTRMDAKDLPPYTRQPEPGVTDKVKKLLGFANGGRVDHAGRKKDIF